MSNNKAFIVRRSFTFILFTCTLTLSQSAWAETRTRYGTNAEQTIIGSSGDPGQAGSDGGDGGGAFAKAETVNTDSSNTAYALGGSGYRGGNGGRGIDADNDGNADGGDGGNSGNGGNAVAIADTVVNSGSATSDAEARGGGISAYSVNYWGTGGSAQGDGTPGTGGDGGDGGKATATANADASNGGTDATATALAIGGRAVDAGGNGHHNTPNPTGVHGVGKDVTATANATGNGTIIATAEAHSTSYRGDPDITATASGHTTTTDSVVVSAEAYASKGTYQENGAGIANASATGSGLGDVSVTATEKAGIGQSSTMINKVSGHTPGSLTLQQNAYGGRGDYEDNPAGSATSILTLDDTTISDVDVTVRAYGGEVSENSSLFGNTAAGDGHASADIRTSGDVSINLEARGGDYGTGGNASIGTVRGESTGGGNVSVSAVLRQGSQLSGGGKGDITLNNAVDGQTTGELALTQSYIGAFDDENRDFAHGSNVTSILNRTENIAGLTLNTNARGGRGSSGLERGDGGDGTAVSTATNTGGFAEATADAYGNSPDLGTPYSVSLGTARGGDGGTGIADATATSTVDYATADADARGGYGADTNTNGGYAGDAGTADATATATGVGVSRAVEATAFSQAGGGGECYTYSYCSDADSYKKGGEANSTATAESVGTGDAKATATAWAGIGGRNYRGNSSAPAFDLLPNGNAYADAEARTAGGGHATAHAETLSAGSGLAKGTVLRANASAYSSGVGSIATASTRTEQSLIKSTAIAETSGGNIIRADGVSKVGGQNSTQPNDNDAYASSLVETSVSRANWESREVGTGHNVLAVGDANATSDTSDSLFGDELDLKAAMGDPLLVGQLGGDSTGSKVNPYQPGGSTSGTHRATLDFSYDLGTSSDTAWLSMALLNAQHRGNGFTTIALEIIVEGQTLLNESFSDLATAESFMDGTLLDLGTVDISPDGILDMKLKWAFSGKAQYTPLQYCDYYGCYNGGYDVDMDAFLFDYAVSASTVPVPPAVWLFGSALGWLGWRRKKAAQAQLSD